MGKRIKKAGAAVLALLLAASVSTSPVAAVQYIGTGSYMSGRYYQALREVRLTGDGREDMVRIARSQLGYQEGGSPNQLSGQVYGGVNHTEYGAWYGVQDMWCAMFVSWCAHVAGVPDTVIPRHSFTPEGLQWFAQRGRAYSREEVTAGVYTPQAGDLVYFKSSRNTRATNHVGLVTGYEKGMLYTLEGNVASAGVASNGGAVVEKFYPITNGFIVYVCSPDYQRSGMSAAPTRQQLSAEKLRKALTAAESGGVLGYGAVGMDQGLSLGIGQWSGSDAVMLLKQIRMKGPEVFDALDTASIGAWLETNTLPYTLEEQSVACLQKLLSSHIGVQVQEERLEKFIEEALHLAQELGYEDAQSQLLCGVMLHLGGQGTVRRCAELAREKELTLPEALEQISSELYHGCQRILSMEELYA